MGTGLTMVDYVLSLDACGHTGPIVAISRRGQLPRADRLQQALAIRAADVPLGAGISELCRWLRNLVATRAAQGADWRSVIDGLRPFNQQIWQHLPEAARRSFLRHGRAWWNVHRHRMPPEIAARIGAATASGRLTVMAARLCAVEPGSTGATIRYQRRGGSAIETMQIDNIVECRGVVTNPMQTSNPVIRNRSTRGAHASILWASDWMWRRMGPSSRAPACRPNGCSPSAQLPAPLFGRSQRSPKFEVNARNWRAASGGPAFAAPADHAALASLPAADSPRSMSAMISSMCSMPTDNRT